MNEEKKLALLIDSDNVSAKYAQYILEEASKYGTLTIKRGYGDWEKNNTGWRIPAMNNSILAVQQNSYIAGKNATDFSMIIDAMDIMYTGNVDGFVLVTSDSDFTRLAIRIREAGKLVVGIGEVKTPIAFTSSCHHFSYLNQVCDAVGDYDEKTLRKAILDYVKENDDGKLDLVKINAYLTSCYGSINYSALGYNRLSMFIDSFSELKRNSNFVSLKRRGGAKPPAQNTANQPSASEITSVIIEYLERKNGKHDDITKIDEYITRTFGKVDFGRFGSKRFARFIDSRSEFVRRGSNVALSAFSNGAKTAFPAPSVPDQKQEEPKPTLRITKQLFIMEVHKYASENMPTGGNLGQLNNMLLDKYGKNYIAELGYGDFISAINSVPSAAISGNFVVMAKEQSAPAEQKREEHPAQSAPAETPETPETAEDDTEEVKLDIYSVKRDIFSFMAQHGNSAPLPQLGAFLTKKYGRGFLKELGFPTMKKLAANINGVKEKSNVLLLEEEFIERTNDIEQFVYDFAHSDGKHSIKALSGKIKKQFAGFDFTDYGYSKFSDFINAIDGVRANGYYIEASDRE